MGSVRPPTQAQKKPPQAYSCARCRSLKKKCSKQLPACISCTNAHVKCVYPGRAPRRTLQQLRDAALREKSNCQIKMEDSMKSLDEKEVETFSNINLVPLTSPKNEPAKEQLIRTNLDALLSSAPPAMVTDNNNNNITNLQSLSRSIIPLPSFKISSTTASTKANNDDSTVEPQLPTPEIPMIETNSRVAAAEDKLSVPISNASLQFESISSIFPGAKEGPRIGKDGTIKELERSLYDRFIAAYFSHNHRTFPMIDKIAFLNKVSTIQNFSQMDGKYEDSFIFKLYMIMAIGCTTLQRVGLVPKEQEDLWEHFAYIAMRKFRNVIKLQNIQTIKCLLLLGIYSFFEPKGMCFFTISGLIMRMVISQGLNRVLPASRAKYMSAGDIELRNRVFWSAYCFERLVATSLGRVSAIDDDEITTPLPHARYIEEEKDLEVTRMTISLRKLSGRIYKEVHSVSAGQKSYTKEEKDNIIKRLRKEIECVCFYEGVKIRELNSNNDAHVQGVEKDMISFHSSDTWLFMRHAQLQIMLYRPSSLIPKPDMQSLMTLGAYCLKALKFTYSLYQKNMLPLNWITLFRALTICNTMLYCLCQWSIDIIESKKEIQECVQILEHFGVKWVFATKCAKVFENISNTLVDVSLSNGQIPNVESLTQELFGASNAYQDILDENNVDVSWSDQLYR